MLIIQDIRCCLCDFILLWRFQLLEKKWISCVLNFFLQCSQSSYSRNYIESILLFAFNLKICLCHLVGEKIQEYWYYWSVSMHQEQEPLKTQNRQRPLTCVRFLSILIDYTKVDIRCPSNELLSISSSQEQCPITHVSFLKCNKTIFLRNIPFHHFDWRVIEL